MDRAQRPAVSKATEEELNNRYKNRPHWQQSLYFIDWLNILARQRIKNNSNLDAYETLLLDLGRLPYELAVHLMWLVTAPVDEIVAWCEDVQWREDVPRPENPPPKAKAPFITAYVAQAGAGMLALQMLGGCVPILG